MHDGRNPLELLGDELTQRQQSGDEVDDGLRVGWEHEEPSALDDIIAAAVLAAWHVTTTSITRCLA